MPRTARIVVPEAPHYVTQRGTDKQVVFLMGDDRHVYLELLGAPIFYTLSTSIPCITAATIYGRTVFYSCAMDEAYYLKALCYVERNPVRA